MINRILLPTLLTKEAFLPFGDVIEASDTPDLMINAGLCERFHDLAKLDMHRKDGRAGISIFKSQARSLPYTFNLMERHPLGSQAFIPMTPEPFLVIVAADCDGIPENPQAFLTTKGQGVNYHANIWHGVLTPLCDNTLFAVIDRIGYGDNLEEHVFANSFQVEKPDHIL